MTLGIKWRQKKVLNHQNMLIKTMEGEIFFLRFYLFARERAHMHKYTRAQVEGGAEMGEADSPLNREPDAGLYPRTPGS